MVSVYVKALVITLVLFIGNFFFVKYLDDSRADALRLQVASMEEEIQSSNALLLYSQVFGDSGNKLCPLLSAETGKQQARLTSLFSQLQEASAANVFADTASIKRRFVIANMQLWLYLQQVGKLCGGSDISPIVYFYNDKGECVECRAQEQVLNGVVSDCAGVRVFAFPFDSNITTVAALQKRYGVTAVPSLIINGTLMAGLQSRDSVVARTGCILQIR